LLDFLNICFLDTLHRILDLSAKMQEEFPARKLKSRNYSLHELWLYLKTVFTEETSTAFVTSSFPPQSVRDPTQSLSQTGEERRGDCRIVNQV
jgi:hypothetical protein